jgi:hypothetical protein
MNERLLDDVVDDMDKQFTDSEYIISSLDKMIEKSEIDDIAVCGLISV